MSFVRRFGIAEHLAFLAERPERPELKNGNVPNLIVGLGVDVLGLIRNSKKGAALLFSRLQQNLNKTQNLLLDVTGTRWKLKLFQRWSARRMPLNANQ